MAGGPVNACATNDCSGSNEPNMQLTVTGASGSVTWCGETWNLPSQSGETRCVCPNDYNLGEPMGATNANQHWWQYAGTTANKGTLALSRVAINGGPQYYQPEKNRLTIRVPTKTITVTDYQSWVFNTTATMTPNYYSLKQIGVLASGAPPQPTYTTNYLLTNDFFSSYTSGGITYTWAKGINWP